MTGPRSRTRDRRWNSLPALLLLVLQQLLKLLDLPVPLLHLGLPHLQLLGHVPLLLLLQDAGRHRSRQLHVQSLQLGPRVEVALLRSLGGRVPRAIQAGSRRLDLSRQASLRVLRALQTLDDLVETVADVEVVVQGLLPDGEKDGVDGVIAAGAAVVGAVVEEVGVLDVVLAVLLHAPRVLAGLVLGDLAVRVQHAPLEVLQVALLSGQMLGQLFHCLQSPAPRTLRPAHTSGTGG